MIRLVFLCLSWTVIFLLNETKAEEIPFDKEPHPYTITFFQIPKNEEQASVKEKKAVKESNMKSGVNKSKIKIQETAHAQTKGAVPAQPFVADNTTSNASAPSNPSKGNSSVINKPVASGATVPSTSTNGTDSNNQTANKRTVKINLPKKHPEPKAQKKMTVKGNQPAKPALQNGKINHEKRKKVANLVSIVNPANARDHALSFQKGAMKHPQHTMYPTCHQCKENSTYASCIKKSTLKKCNEGLNNICYTRSVKRNSIIHYEMGCADHNSCMGARAFPCRDGSVKCFTCCQWDKCNSSPHHGDYELDSVNLDELENGCLSVLPSYLIPVSLLCNFIAMFFLM